MTSVGQAQIAPVTVARDLALRDLWAALAAGLGPLLVVRAYGARPSALTGLAMILAGVAGVLLWRYGFEFTSAIYDVLPGMLAGFLVYGTSLIMGSTSRGREV